MIDLFKLAAGFKRGDVVHRFSPTFNLSPYVGRVTAVHRGLGVLDVQWPHANERVSADDVIKVNPDVMQFLPPEFDDSYDSYDIQKARKRWASVSPWAGSTLPAGLYTGLARSWACGASEVAAYDEAWHRYAASGVNDEALRGEVQKFYRLGQRLGDLRIKQHVKRTAAYWVAQNRQYRVTSNEVSIGKPRCPKCATTMRRTTYKMDKGARVSLFACPKDLFLIKANAIVGPLGEPVGW